MTYQSILASDGSYTNVVNLYEDGAMTWKPVFDVPNDIPYFPAISGYVIKSEISHSEGFTASELSASGKLNEFSDSVYRLDEVNFPKLY